MKPVVRSYIVNELLSGRAVRDDEELLVSGLVDSIGVMRLVAYLERQCAMKIPPQDVTIEHFATVDAITAYLTARVPA